MSTLINSNIMNLGIVYVISLILKLEYEGIKEVKRMEKITRRMILSKTFHHGLVWPYS